MRNQSHFSAAMAGFANSIAKKQKMNQDDILVGDGAISEGSSQSPPKKEGKDKQMMSL